MRSRVGERVRSALAAGWYSFADGMAALSWIRYEARPGRGMAHNLTVRAGDREVQIGISPGGQSVQVFVDGQQIPKEK